MKKKLALLLIFTLTLTLFSIPAFASDEIKLEINGNIVTPSVAPVIENGTTLVPLRIISENLGATVEWDGTVRQVNIAKDETKIVLTIDKTTAIVNDMDTTLLLAPKIINGSTMVPIRFVSENLGVYVNWDSSSRTVQISATNDFTKPEAETPVQTTVTTGQKNALEKAKSYLSIMNFSREGLIDQLEFEKFTTDEAIYAVDNCNVNWNEQALGKAKDYLAVTAFSYSGLVEQLEFEGFTHEQALYGVDRCGADWNEQAALKAESYMGITSFSRERLIDQLEFEGFTYDQALYGVKAVGY